MIQTVNKVKNISCLALTAALVYCAAAASAQQSFYEGFRAHNAQMTAVQPTWMGPLIQTDARLAQSVRLSFSNSYTQARTQTVSYGNYHTLGLIFGDRIQLNLIAPPYIQNNFAALKDGFGDTQVETKYRIASGNAEHGNYAVTAKLTYNAPTASHLNGAATTVWVPTLAAGRAWGRFDVQTALGGILPTGKIAAQGRGVEWNTTAQVLAGTNLWLDVEDAGGVLRAAAQGMETGARRGGAGRRNADRHVQLLSVQSQPDFRGAHPVLVDIANNNHHNHTFLFYLLRVAEHLNQLPDLQHLQ
jgi:hypothetical protein